MSISGTMTYTMTDAEFLLFNGVPAPTIDKSSPLYEIGATATSSAGTTTVTLPVSKRDSNNFRRLARIMERVATSYGIAKTI